MDRRPVTGRLFDLSRPIRKVTAADVKRVAAKYLLDDQSTTG